MYKDMQTAPPAQHSPDPRSAASTAVRYQSVAGGRPARQPPPTSRVTRAQATARAPFISMQSDLARAMAPSYAPRRAVPTQAAVTQACGGQRPHQTSHLPAAKTAPGPEGRGVARRGAASRDGPVGNSPRRWLTLGSCTQCAGRHARGNRYTCTGASAPAQLRGDGRAGARSVHPRRTSPTSAASSSTRSPIPRPHATAESAGGVPRCSHGDRGNIGGEDRCLGRHGHHQRARVVHHVCQGALG